MRQSRFSDQDIRSILDELEGGAHPAELAEKYGVSVPTIYRWKSRFREDQPKRMRELEEENQRLRKIVADQALDLEAVKSLLRKRKT